MQTYSILREIADSWVLLAMFGFFVGAILWAFRPGSTATYKDVSQIPLRNETISSTAKTCTGTCASCTSATAVKSLEGIGDV
ncbi:MAG: cbb3-type cytochrome c oxidase subunit 3 [Albidovulum sp.]